MTDAQPPQRSNQSGSQTNQTIHGSTRHTQIIYMRMRVRKITRPINSLHKGLTCPFPVWQKSLGAAPAQARVTQNEVGLLLRLSIHLFIHVREACTLLICIPGYPLPVQDQPRGPPILHHNSSPRHVNSRMLPGVTRMKCVSTETPREDSDRSACATHCEQRLQLREQKTLAETSQEVTRSADACLSLSRVAFKLHFVVYSC